MAAFHLSRMGADDVPDFVDILYAAFPEPYAVETFSGPDTSEMRAFHEKNFTKSLQTGAAAYWIKATETSTGRMVGCSSWGICPHVMPNFDKKDPVELPWLDHDPEKHKEVSQRYTDRNALQKKYYTEPHLENRIFAVHPDFARRGAGALMMTWGCALADQMFLPIWIIASRPGMKLYANFDCHPVAPAEGGADGMLMKREARASKIYGGKLVTPQAAKVDGPGLNVAAGSEEVVQ